MQIDAHKDVGRLGKVAQGLLNQNPAAAKALANCDIRLGPAKNERYGLDGDYIRPLFVGDSEHLRAF